MEQLLLHETPQSRVPDCVVIAFLLSFAGLQVLVKCLHAVASWPHGDPVSAVLDERDCVSRKGCRISTNRHWEEGVLARLGLKDVLRSRMVWLFLKPSRVGGDAGRPIASLAFYLDGDLLAIAAGHHVSPPACLPPHAFGPSLAILASSRVHLFVSAPAYGVYVRCVCVEEGVCMPRLQSSGGLHGIANFLAAQVRAFVVADAKKLGGYVF